MPSGERQGMSDEEWARHQRIIAGFEAAWKRGDRPRIGDHAPDSEPRRDELLVELVHAELEFRLKLGERARVEEYLRDYPCLGARRQTMIGLIRSEYTIRRRREPELKLERYRRRFPEFLAELETPRSLASTVGAPAPGGPKQAFEGPMPAELPLPRRLGRYELRERVGQGSFGLVYRAWDTVLRREVAVKLPRPEVAAAQHEIRAFLREARNAADLRHPNIVAILDAGPIDGTECLVRSYVEGTTLAERLRERPYSLEEAARLMIPVAEAVQYAHARGIIHRDLKPPNILIDAQGQPYVSDFGLAKREAGDTTLSPAGSAGIMIGTPAYMSPEQARGDASVVDARSDVYSLGVLLYELITGALPFRGRGRMLEVQIQNAAPISPRSLNDEVPPDLEAICLKCLAKRPLDRYQAASGLAEDLRGFLDGRPVLARPRVEPRPPTTRRRWPSTRRRVAAVGIAALLLALATTTSLWLRADALRGRDADGLQKVYEALLGLAAPIAPSDGASSLPLDVALRARVLAGELSSTLDADPALLEVSADVALRLADRASAEGADREAGPRWERAVRSCRSSIARYPDRASRLADLARASSRLAEIRRRAGQRDEASKLLAQAASAWTGALQARKSWLDRHPDDLEALVEVAEYRLRLAEVGRAAGTSADIQEVEWAARDLERPSGSRPPSLARRLARLNLEVAEYRLLEGHARPAEEAASSAHRNALESRPGLAPSTGLARAALTLARANAALDRPSTATARAFEAVRHFEALVRLDPTSPEDRRGLAEALFEAARLVGRPGHPLEAIDLHRRSLVVWVELDRDHPRAHATLAGMAEGRAALASVHEAQGSLALAFEGRAMALFDQARAVVEAPGEASYRARLVDRAWALARVVSPASRRRAGASL